MGQGAQMKLFDEKTGGRKSHDRVPLRGLDPYPVKNFRIRIQIKQKCLDPTSAENVIFYMHHAFSF
jgi:hypothetical protein